MLYTELDREVAAIGPVCELSGRCCRFMEYGHTLFVSTAEVELPARLGARRRPAARPGRNLPVAEIRAGTARPAKAGRWGAAIYYCDPSFQEDAHRLSERFIDRMKRLSRDHGIPWNYAPLHRHLHEERSAGPIRLRILLDTTLSHQYT